MIRSLIQRVLRWAAEPAVVAQDAKKGISQSALSRIASTNTPPQAFGRPQAMDGVIPAEDHSAVMAMDDQLAPVYSFANALGFGGGGHHFPGYAFLSELSQRPEYRIVSEIPAKEATRKWIKLTNKGDEDLTDELSELDDYLKSMNLRSVFRDALEQDGLFGRAQFYIDMKKPGGGLAADDPNELTSPLLLSPAKIKKGSLLGFKLIEPIWTYPTVFNADKPLKPDFYRPMSWYVMGQKVHASRMLNFVSRPVADILKPSYNFGGVSMSQLCAPYIEGWIETRDSVTDLIHSFSTSGIKTNMESVSGGGTGDDLYNRIALYTQMRDNRGALVLDKDTEEFFQFNTPLGGLSELQKDKLEQICAISHIPAIKLLGIQPSGMNADSDGEIRVFYDWIHGLQEDVYTPNLSIALQIAQLSLWGEVNPDIGFEYVPLWQMDDKDLATVRKSDGDRDVAYIQAGVLAPEEVRASLAADPESGYDTIDVEDVPEPPAPPPMNGEEEEGSSEDDDDAPAQE
jgi:phage-related protein (TIGR01555 family)